MKFNKKIYLPSKNFEKLLEIWKNATIQIGLDTGIHVEVGIEYGEDISDISVQRIYFEINDHQFEGLSDLKKAIANKAFL